MSFIVLNIDDIAKIDIFFDNIYTHTYFNVKIITKKNAQFSSANYDYCIYIVPDDINIIDYIRNKAIITTSEIWFYDNKLEGTNLPLLLSNETKGYLKEEYLNLFIDNLDRKIINNIKRFSNNGIQVIIDTSKYTKKEIKYDNTEKISIVSFLRAFYNNDEMLEYFLTTINKKRYSKLDIFKDGDKKLLYNRVNFILSISYDNNYNIEKLKTIFRNLHNDNYEKLTTIIQKIIDAGIPLHYLEECNIIYINKILTDLIYKIRT